MFKRGDGHFAVVAIVAVIGGAALARRSSLFRKTGFPTT